jgi:hypothetical protein
VQTHSNLAVRTATVAAAAAVAAAVAAAPVAWICSGDRRVRARSGRTRVRVQDVCAEWEVKTCRATSTCARGVSCRVVSCRVVLCCCNVIARVLPSILSS